jgi:hypothetical protein
MKDGKDRLMISIFRPVLFFMVFMSLLLTRCTREDPEPDRLYADPLTVALRFTDDAGLMQAGLMKFNNFMIAFGDINSSSRQLVFSDSVLRDGVQCRRECYLWNDTSINYRRGNINYPGKYIITEISPGRHDLNFDLSFYRIDSLRVFKIQGSMFISTEKSGNTAISGSFNLTDPAGKLFRIKIDMKKQPDSGQQSNTFNDDRWLIESTGIISADGKDIRFASLTPLVRVSSPNCDFQSGETGISSGGWPAQIFSYGNGGCDRLYFLSENSNQIEITLP